MRLLLDTHVLIWLAEGSDELARPARAQIEDAAAGAGLAVSAITFWEIAMLGARRRIALSRPVSELRRLVLERAGILESPVTGDVAIESVLLPDLDPGDPADRLIVATARTHGWRLATRDARILAYGAAGHVDVVAV